VIKHWLDGIIIKTHQKKDVIELKKLKELKLHNQLKQLASYNLNTWMKMI
jgi:hypothetical protein